MFSQLTVFQTAHAMAVHAGARQALIAQNVANADTPGYVARDLPEFSAALARDSRDPGRIRATRPRHVMQDLPVRVTQLRPFSEEQADPDMNGVSLEAEMARAADVKRDHDRALAIYRSALTILRMSLGKS
ncbi:MAG: FlgB family protein [Ruegeria sp.]